jgi:uncharacterized membrane protein YhaH (DUF805 family)
MRGVVLEFSGLSGTGLISGDDNGRYSFSKAEVRSTTPIQAGQQVDFEPGSDGVARAIFILNTAGATPSPAPGQAHGYSHAQYDLPAGHGSLRYGLNPFQFFWKCMTLYFDGRGRATVAEYWSFTLVYTLIVLVGVLLFGGIIAAVAEGGGSRASEDAATALVVILGVVLLIGLIIPSITVTIRRLHDIGATGWLYLLVFIPYIGGLVIFVMSLIGSQRYPNQYGPYYRDVINGTADVQRVFG